MVAKNDGMWRNLVNSLPDSKVEAPKEPSAIDQEFFVQRVVTEVFVYTDLSNNEYSSDTFQSVDILGRMSEKKLMKFLRRRRKQQEQST